MSEIADELRRRAEECSSAYDGEDIGWVLMRPSQLKEAAAHIEQLEAGAVPCDGTECRLAAELVLAFRGMRYGAPHETVQQHLDAASTMMVETRAGVDGHDAAEAEGGKK